MGLSFLWSSAAFLVQRTVVVATETGAVSVTGGAAALATVTGVAVAVAAPGTDDGLHPYFEIVAGEETGIGLGMILTVPGLTDTVHMAVAPQRGWASTRREEWEGLGPADPPLSP